MAARRKIIIDTDPGVDDVLAILLALSATPEEVEVMLISLTYGNVDVDNCLRNTVALFHHIENEIQWRRKTGKPTGFTALQASKPIIAIGSEKPLADQLLMADYFHGVDGLGGIHNSHPHLTPGEHWKELFHSSSVSSKDDNAAVIEEMQHPSAHFRPSNKPSYEEILRLLRENDQDTITIVAIGPLTNLAKAAAQDPETFLRAKEVVVMGGMINQAGNVRLPPPPITPPSPPSPPSPPFRLTKAPSTPLRIALNLRNQITPVAEFNTFADSVAAARLYALSSPRPKSTMPPVPPSTSGNHLSGPPPPFLGPYPDHLPRRLNISLFPLDITSSHEMARGQFTRAVGPLIKAGSPLAAWTEAFMSSTFRKIESLDEGASGDNVGLALHDPLCIWYILTGHQAGWRLNPDQDLRIETSGQWTRGMCVVDRRNRRRRTDDTEGEIPSDTGDWLSPKAGNRLNICVDTPGHANFAPYLLNRIFGI